MKKLIVFTCVTFFLTLSGANAGPADVIYQESITNSATYRMTFMPGESDSIIFEETTDGNPEFGIPLNSLIYSHSIQDIEPPILPDGKVRMARLKLYLRNHSDADVVVTVDSLNLKNAIRRNFLLGPTGNEYITVEGSPLFDGHIELILSSEEHDFAIYRSVFDMRYEPASTTDVDEHSLKLRSSFMLSDNYPNPFNPSTAIEYSLYARSAVRIKIFDAVGRLVRTLVDRVQPAGDYTVYWDGKDDDGNPTSSGIYFCRMNTGIFSDSRKMLLLK